MTRTRIPPVFLTTIVLVTFVPVASAHYDPALGRWLERDLAGFVDGMNLYQYVRCEPTTLRDPFGKVSAPQTSQPAQTSPAGWSWRLNHGPRLLDGRDPSYQIFVDHVLPAPPQDATQVWQVVKCNKMILAVPECKIKLDTEYIVDIVAIADRKIITDSLAWIWRQETCFAAEVCHHDIGFDDGRSNYVRMSNAQVSEKSANELLGKMRGPKGAFSTTYYYLNKGACGKCCKVLKKILHYLNVPDGERLHVEGVGTWTSS